MKRIGFVSVQNQQGIYADGYEVQPLRTGYEQLVAHRATSLFATSAEQSGVVTEVSKRALTVEYKDGTKKKFALGTRHGKSAGTTYPHEVVTDLKEGSKVKEGEILTYNRKFFSPDPMNPGQVSLKTGVMCTTALVDNIDTLEDGSSISKETAKKLTTQTTEIRTLEVRNDQSVRDLVKVGDEVDIDSILCIIEDPELAVQTGLDPAALETLKRLQAMTPKAKVHGKVSKIECYYHGEPEEFSESLMEIVQQSDKERRIQAKAEGKPAFTGQVIDNSFRIRGKALDPEMVAIQIYIDHNVGAGVGDKGVFGNQMKTVFSRVMDGENRTEDGTPIDALFGNTSVEDRMVLSPKLIGTTNMLLKVLSKRVAETYRGQPDE